MPRRNCALIFSGYARGAAFGPNSQGKAQLDIA
jgi:hypothetical protein